MKFEHVPVLAREVREYLRVKPDGIYVDGTLGGGGHAYETASQLTQGGRLIGIDQDTDALAAAGQRLAPFADRVKLVHDNYENMAAVLADCGIAAVDGILLDLGVSSFQLDNPERGFTYREDDAPLDMRMDQDGSLTAETIVNTWSEKELTRILREYGEERFAARIAAGIVKMRQEEPVVRAGQLNAVIRDAIPRKMREKGGHPSKRTFQALRIACNRELDVLRDSLDTMIDLLAPGGRLCVITFHSLEDRIVKNAFRNAENPCICPPSFPVCTCGRVSKGKVLTRKAVKPSEEELERNRRSASAGLRVFEKRTEQL
ncbi:MAG: 16S rRNA (cytosine(1402)-N(4))-methyltransferase RsmH [Lachnospiraceae bacterium]|nr:16S rRNA (cytosine(1402)-N(4))-methyltransferase RsmH [Lachnospiraceae bacterium]